MPLTVYSLIEAVWLILPAYAANGLAPLSGGRRRMDFGRQFRGNPLFGAGKTWEGLFVGVFMAVLVSLVQMEAHPLLPWAASPVLLEPVAMGPLLGLLLGLGAMLGDLCGAFIKRRLGMKRGRPAPGLDQLDFVAGALLAAGLAVTIRWEWAVILLVLTPAIHLAANGMAYLLKVKKEPY